ncbi:MAG: hypothetical protein P8Y08_14415 [Desulfobulbaceae bacterium]
MKFVLVTFSIILITALPTHAQSVDELRQQLDTQKQINEVLKQRIRSLEKQLSETLDDNTSEKIYEESLPVPDKAPSDSVESRALERVKAAPLRGLWYVRDYPSCHPALGN